MESKVTNKRNRKIKEAINKASKQVIKNEINESYTSICSFYDNEEIKKQDVYLGKRIINADINGALNIMTKSKTERNNIISFLRNRGQTVPIRQKIKFN